MNKDKILEALEECSSILKNPTLPIEDKFKLSSIIDFCKYQIYPGPFKNDASRKYYNECKTDFVKFCELCVTGFKLERRHQIIIESLNERGNSRLLIKHPRQIGATFIITLYNIWKCIFNEGYSVCFVYGNFQNAEIILNLIGRLNGPFDKNFVEVNKKEIRFKNGSRIKMTSESSVIQHGDIRTSSYNNIVLEQIAYFETPVKLVREITPALKGGLTLVSSGVPLRDIVNLCKDLNVLHILNIKLEDCGFDASWAFNRIRSKGMESFEREYIL
jgi:hypothetical protein